MSTCLTSSVSNARSSAIRFLLDLHSLALVVEVEIDAAVVFEVARGGQLQFQNRRRRYRGCCAAQHLSMSTMKCFCSFSDAIEPIGSGRSGAAGRWFPGSWTGTRRRERRGTWPRASLLPKGNDRIVRCLFKFRKQTTFPYVFTS